MKEGMENEKEDNSGKREDAQTAGTDDRRLSEAGGGGLADRPLQRQSHGGEGGRIPETEQSGVDDSHGYRPV